MHTAFLYFIYSTRAGQKALQQSYKPESAKKLFGRQSCGGYQTLE
jgi:hypothetical protein